MKPMLLSEYPKHQSEINAENYVFIQPKLNGWRALVNTHTGVIYSREGNALNLPHITADILKQKNLPEWIDGEIYIHGGDHNTIKSALPKKDRRIKFYCFDCIIPGSQQERINKIYQINETKNIRIVATSKIKPSEIDRCYQEYLNMNLEGAVIRMDSPYYQGRSTRIFKLKPIYD